MSREWMDEAPDIRVLWDKVHTARRPHLCDACNEEISPGTKYENRGLVEDGEFKSEKVHRFAYQYPSGCPRFAERDKADLAEQFEKDKAAGC